MVLSMERKQTIPIWYFANALTVPHYLYENLPMQYTVIFFQHLKLKISLKKVSLICLLKTLIVGTR